MDHKALHIIVDFNVRHKAARDMIAGIMRYPSLPLENLKIAFPPKPACVFRLRAS